MVEIPANSTNFLPLKSYIMCFFKPERFSEAELRQAVDDGDVERLGCLSRRYLYKIQSAVQNDFLEDEYIQEIMMVLAKAIISVQG